MKTVNATIEAIQQSLLGVLHAFDKYCKRNGLEYHLGGGSLLGAVRHKGFIPWDDDVDVTMFPDEFARLEELASENPFIDDELRYMILRPGEWPNFCAFIKVFDTYTLVHEHNLRSDAAMGIGVDVFCLDAWPDDDAEREKLYRHREFYANINKLCLLGNPDTAATKVAYPLALAFRNVAKLFGVDSAYCIKKIIELSTGRDGVYVGSVRWPAGKQDRFLRSYYDDIIYIDFEDMKLPAPAGYDGVLTALYGDYMTLPPVDKRVSHDYRIEYVYP